MNSPCLSIWIPTLTNLLTDPPLTNTFCMGMHSTPFVSYHHISSNTPSILFSVLCRVLVHSGDLSGGHYFAFVKPNTEGKWLKFDDDRVVPSTIKEVLEENYGGEPAGTLNNTKPNGRTFKRFTNAYMLVYIRKSMLDDILADVTVDDIPQHLSKLQKDEYNNNRTYFNIFFTVQRLEEEHKQQERRRKDKEQQHLFMHILVSRLYQLLP